MTGYLCAIMKKEIIIDCKLPAASSGLPLPLNLREKNARLTPVGEPAIIASGVNAAYPLGIGEHLCVASDKRTLSVASGLGIDACGSLRNDFVGLCPAGEGGWWIFSADGASLLTREANGSYSLQGPPPGFGTVKISARVQTSATVNVTPRTLSGDYSRGYGSLTSADCTQLGADMLEGWRALKARASTAGSYIQPVLMAWRLIDRAGQVLFCSAPQWVSPDGGFQLTGKIRSGVRSVANNYCAVDAFNLECHTWKPVVGIYASGVSRFWAEQCHRLELIAMPQIDFTDCSNQMAEGRIDLDSSGQSVLSAFMPGASAAFSPDTQTLSEATILSLSRFADDATVVASVAMPFLTPSTREVSVDHNGPKASSASLPPQFAMPNRFAASTILESGSALFMAGIRAIGSPGAYPSDIAATTMQSPCKEQVILTLADGSVRAVARTDSPIMAQTLPPLIVVPDPDATALTLCIDNEAMTFTLSRSRCGRFAFWLSAAATDVKWTPVARTWQVVASSETPRELPGAILCAHAATPLNPVSAHTICTSEIHRLTHAVGASGGWNFARRHFVAWAADGIYAVSADHLLLSVGASLIHSPGISRADAVATSAECALAATTSGELIRLSGSRARSVPVPLAARAVGWNPTMAELWIADDHGTPYILTSSDAIYRRSPMSVSSFCNSHGGCLHLLDANGKLRDTGLELSGGTVDVEWSQQVELTLPKSTILSWMIDAEEADLTLSLTASDGGGESCLSSLHVTGSINAPITARVYAPVRTFLTATITGTVSAPANFRRIRAI